ncbi:MAG: metallophosphoesterase [Lachnospiraceae bacterium]|nr:metallophosphoesterase [Lachnospiraceae bacterium]
MVLFTSDVHSGIDQGFGYVGLQQVRDALEAEGYATILVDNGDSIQGEALATLTRGEANIELMNAAGYDAAIPGNHEFDFGADRFLELADMADYPYVCCNLLREGEPVFEPYVIVEAAGMKIAFVGVTTPTTVTSSTPAFFQNEDGEYIYDFLQDETGERVYQAVQDAADGARAGS